MNTPNIKRDTAVLYNFKCPRCKATKQRPSDCEEQPTCECGCKMKVVSICGRLRRVA